jgi:hypothetical protein
VIRRVRIAWRAEGALRTTALAENGVNGSGEATLSHRGEEELREEISFHLTLQVIGLVGG